ncbi:substrate-binding domain-containing protein [Nocardia sp. NPDC050408]|uniref:substrate-binding domain-containing protein n=1 Tax=Nocardia sp. NPDC050408 TaxID=3364319 RepID=UPI00378AFBE5
MREARCRRSLRIPVHGLRTSRRFHAALEDYRFRADTDRIRLRVEKTVEAQAVVDELLELADPPTVFFALNNRCTIGTIRSLHVRQLSNERAVIGFDDFELADMLLPAVTVVGPNVTAMGRIATERLLARINGDDSAPQTSTLPVHLIARGSGEILPDR